MNMAYKFIHASMLTTLNTTCKYITASLLKGILIILNLTTIKKH